MSTTSCPSIAKTTETFGSHNPWQHPPPIYTAREDERELQNVEARPLEDDEVDELSRASRPEQQSNHDAIIVTLPQCDPSPADRPFGYFRPKYARLRKNMIWIGILALLIVIASIAMAIYFGLKNSRQPVPPTTAAPMTILPTSTIFRNSTSTSISTLISTQSTTNPQTTTLLQPTTTTLVQTSLVVTTLPRATETTTITQTAIPTALATTCNDLIAGVCSGAQTVPNDDTNNDWGECTPLLKTFYCGYNKSPCSGLKNFCKAS